MFNIGQVFHVSHVVDDLEAAVRWYEEVLSAQVWQSNQIGGVPLALLLVGDVSFMPMAPPVGSPGSPRRFLERYGPRLHSLALYVTDPVDLIEHLRSNGLRLTGHDGNELRDPRDEIWTQPRETPMVFEFFEPRESMGDPRTNDPAWRSSFSSEEHPMGVTGTHFTVVTSDLAAATGNLVDNFRGRVVHDSNQTVHGTRSSFVELGRNVVVEVAEPLDRETQAGRDLAAGGRFHAVTLLVRELAFAVHYLQSRQVGVHEVGPGDAVLDRADTHGVLFRLSERPLSEW
jgi:catechol 2,3-dioxygenase-like lactoylglutathione lyase family enzyme